MRWPRWKIKQCGSAKNCEPIRAEINMLMFKHCYIVLGIYSYNFLLGNYEVDDFCFLHLLMKSASQLHITVNYECILFHKALTDKFPGLPSCLNIVMSGFNKPTWQSPKWQVCNLQSANQKCDSLSPLHLFYSLFLEALHQQWAYERLR